MESSVYLNCFIHLCSGALVNHETCVHLAVAGTSNDKRMTLLACCRWRRRQVCVCSLRAQRQGNGKLSFDSQEQDHRAGEYLTSD
jgi:hypothetical protein